MLSLIGGCGEFTWRIRRWHLIPSNGNVYKASAVKFLVTLDRISFCYPFDTSWPRRSRRVSRTCWIELAHGSVSAYLVVDRARQALFRTFIFFLLAMYCRFLDYLIVNHRGPDAASSCVYLHSSLYTAVTRRSAYNSGHV